MSQKLSGVIKEKRKVCSAETYIHAWVDESDQGMQRYGVTSLQVMGRNKNTTPK
jgi:hypothetical protein